MWVPIQAFARGDEFRYECKDHGDVQVPIDELDEILTDLALARLVDPATYDELTEGRRDERVLAAHGAG
jgi:hypothetical protein